jgi:GTP-binding protein
MDLLTPSLRERAEKKAREVLHFLPWVPLVKLSAKTGRGITALMTKVSKAHAEYTRRVTTSQLNLFFTEALERHPPPTKGGRAPRVYYLTQAQTAPPVFVAMCSHPESIQEAYRRYVTNQLRAAFGFESIPIHVRFRARRREAGRA